MMKGFESKISDEYQKFENPGRMNLKLNRFKEIKQSPSQISQKTEKSNLKQNKINIPQNGPIKLNSNIRRLRI